MRGCRGRGSWCNGLERTSSVDEATEAENPTGREKSFRLTLSPHVLVAVAVTGDILGACVAHWLLIASKHVVEEVELGVRDRGHQDKSPQGLAPITQHFQGPGLLNVFSDAN